MTVLTPLLPSCGPSAELLTYPRLVDQPRLLVVDDEPSIRLLCSINLEMSGYEVRQAADGATALEEALDGSYDLMLLDVMLPDIGGFEVARRLAADDRARDLPIVFLSARTDRADVRAGFEAGGIEYITKPFDPIALGGRIGEILEQVGSGDAAAMRRRGLAALDDGE